ncbi:MAG: DUF423 domain-containing protein [Prosthecobacter sp.]
MSPDPLRLRISALMGFLAISLGASGAHGPVHEKLKAAGGQALEHWGTAVQYHLPHAVALLVLTLCVSGTRPFTWAWRLIFLGMLLFSGSLYTLAYTGMKWLGAVTPLGGLCLMGGWVAIALAAKDKPSESKNS